MPNIRFSDDDYEFLTARAELEGITVEEYVSNMVDRQRVIVKYPAKPATTPKDKPSNIEPPHRKWGM